MTWKDKKMDMKSQNDDKWLKSLGLLFQACEPLTYDCLLTNEEVKEQQYDIEHHTFYCLHVKLAIEDGVEALSFDEWSAKEKDFLVTASAEPYVPAAFNSSQLDMKFK